MMIKKKKVFLTGATGGMGSCGFKELLKEPEKYNIVILARPLAKDKEMLKPYEGLENLKIVWGDLTNYNDVVTCVNGKESVD